jgi:hypothetical protein
MRTDLKRIKLLFKTKTKTKTQPANNSNGQGGDEWYSTEVNWWMHNGDAKIVDLIEEHLQTKEKLEWKEDGKSVE